MDENIRIPEHIGIIMDGNGRWAKKRMLPRNAGHKKGAEVFQDITNDQGVKIGILWHEIDPIRLEK